MNGPGFSSPAHIMSSDLFLPTPEQPGQILVVEDQADNLRLLALGLEGHPFRLTAASSGSEAVERCGATAFEGILMDVHLPGMSGLEACRKIQESPLNGRTPLIFISAYRIGGEAMVAGLEAGGMDYLSKPYSLPELLAKLRMMVRLSRQQRAVLESERQRALLEVAGGAAHELSQPLSRVQLMVDQWELQGARPTPEQISQVQEILSKVNGMLHQFQNLRTYVTKPYATGEILDLEESHRASRGPSDVG